MYANLLALRDRVNELLTYDPLTGQFTWRAGRLRSVKVGDVAGYVQASGYRYVMVDRHNHRAHRLAWLVVHGTWPAGVIDHKNGLRDDNRMANLRDVTRLENQLNRQQAIGVSGLIGASPYPRDKNRWLAQIKRDGKARTLGIYDTKEQAHAAYLAAREADRLARFGADSIAVPVSNFSRLGA